MLVDTPRILRYRDVVEVKDVSVGPTDNRGSRAYTKSPTESTGIGRGESSSIGEKVLLGG